MKKALLTRYNYTEDGYRKRFREATPETEETPDQFVIRLKNNLAKWLELSGSSPDNFGALVDLIVKEHFINACSEDLAMYLLERGPKDLVELTMWAQKYLIAHKEQQGKSKATVQPRCADLKKMTQSSHKDARGRCSATVVKVLDTGDQSVVQRLVPARIRRVRRHQSVRVARRRLVSWWLSRPGRRKGFHVCRIRGNQIQEKFEEECVAGPV